MASPRERLGVQDIYASIYCGGAGQWVLRTFIESSEYLNPLKTSMAPVRWFKPPLSELSRIFVGYVETNPRDIEQIRALYKGVPTVLVGSGPAGGRPEKVYTELRNSEFGAILQLTIQTLDEVKKVAQATSPSGSTTVDELIRKKVAIASEMVQLGGPWEIVNANIVNLISSVVGSGFGILKFLDEELPKSMIKKTKGEETYIMNTLVMPSIFESRAGYPRPEACDFAAAAIKNNKLFTILNDIDFGCNSALCARGGVSATLDAMAQVAKINDAIDAGDYSEARRQLWAMHRKTANVPWTEFDRLIVSGVEPLVTGFVYKRFGEIYGVGGSSKDSMDYQDIFRHFRDFVIPSVAPVELLRDYLAFRSPTTERDFVAAVLNVLETTALGPVIPSDANGYELILSAEGKKLFEDKGVSPTSIPALIGEEHGHAQAGVTYTSAASLRGYIGMAFLHSPERISEYVAEKLPLKGQ